MNEKMNTDREIYRAPPGDWQADSVFITEGGALGLNCGGMVHVRLLREWHRLASKLSEREEIDNIVDSLRIIIQRRGRKIQQGDVLAVERAINALTDTRREGPRGDVTAVNLQAAATEGRDGAVGSGEDLGRALPASASASPLPWNVERELERALIHGPDSRTIDALELAIDRYKAAERDFIQVHKNCIEARARAEKAEEALGNVSLHQTICIGEHTVAMLRDGKDVVIEDQGVTLIRASEALRQALAYHCSGYSANKSASPDQVVATARKFEAFLDGKNEKRMHSLSS